MGIEEKDSEPRPRLHVTRDGPALLSQRVSLYFYDVTDGHSSRKLLGSASYNKFTCHLRELRVDVDDPYKIVRNRMLSEVERTMKLEGCTACTVFTKAPGGFYLANGYEHPWMRNTLTGSWMKKNLS